MAISYLSKPIAPGVIPQQENIGLIAQVAAEKQNKYDNILGSIFAQYNNLLNLDTSANNAITEKYNGLMSEATKNLASLAKLNLENPASIPKVESVFDPILNDVSIMDAVARTKLVQEDQKMFDYWKKSKNDLYSPLNEASWTEDYLNDKNLSAEDFATKRKGYRAVAYRDLPDKIIKQLKTLPQVKNVVMSPKGGWIVETTKDESKPISEMMRYIQLDANDLAQARINAWAENPNVTAEEILTKNIKSVKADIDIYTNQNKLIKSSSEVLETRLKSFGTASDETTLTTSQIQEYKKIGIDVNETTTIGDMKQLFQGQLERNKFSTEQNIEGITSLNEALNQYKKKTEFIENPDGTISFNKTFDEDAREQLRTQNYVQELKQTLAMGQFYQNESIKLEKDEFALKKLDFEYDLIKKQLDLQKEIALVKYKGKGGVDSEGNPIPSNSPNGDVLPMTGTTVNKEDYTQETFQAEKEAVKSNLAKTKIDLMEYLYNAENNTNTGIPSNISPLKKKQLEETAAANMEIANKGLEAIKNGKAIIIGEVTFKEDEFRTKYAKEIGALESMVNNEAALKLYDEIESQITARVNTIPISDEFRIDALNAGGIVVKDESNKLSIKEGGQPNTFYRLPPTLMDQLQKKGKQELTKADYKAIYDANPKNHGFQSLDEFMKSVNSRGFQIGNKQYIAKNPRQEALESEYKKLAETTIVPSYVIKSGSNMYKEIKDVLKAELATKQSVLPEDKDLSFYLERDVNSQSGFKAVATVKGEKDVVSYPIPLTPELLDRYPEFKTLGSVMEIDNILALMQREMAARENDSYQMYGMKDKPSVEIQFMGKRYRITAESKERVSMLDLSQGFNKGNRPGMPYSGTGSPSTFLLNMYAPNQDTDLDMFYQNFSQQIKKLIK